MNPLDYIIKKAKGIVESGKKSLFKEEIGQSKIPVLPKNLYATPYTPPTSTYKSPSSLSYTQPKPFNAIDTVIQKTGGLISKDYIQSPLMQQAKLAGDEVANLIRKPLTDAFNKIQTSATGLEKSLIRQDYTPGQKLDFTDASNVTLRAIANYSPQGFTTQAIYNGLGSLYKATTGNDLPKITVPALGGRGDILESKTSQEYYNDQIASGATPNKAFWDTTVKTVMDMTILVPMLRQLSKETVKNVSPTSLIDTKVTSVDRDTIRDYLTGRKTPEDLKLPAELKQSIADTLKNATREEKVKMLGGIDLLEVKPSALGKVLGLSEQEANTILKGYGGTVRETPTSALPGTAIVGQPQPAMGLSIQPVKKVGYRDPTVVEASKKVTPEMKVNIIAIIDDARLNKGKNLSLQEDAVKMTEDLGLPMKNRYADIVNQLEDVKALSDNKVVVETPSVTPKISPQQVVIPQVEQALDNKTVLSKLSSYLKSENPQIRQRALDLQNEYRKTVENDKPGVARSMLKDMEIYANKITTPANIPATTIKKDTLTIPKSVPQKSVLQKVVEQYKKLPKKGGMINFGVPLRGNKIDEATARLELKRDLIENSPFNSLNLKKITNIREGGIRELGDVKNPEITRVIEDMMAEVGIEDPQEFVEKAEQFLEIKRDLKLSEQELKNISKIKDVIKVIKKRIEKERGFVTSIKEALPNLERIAGQYVPRSTDELSIKAKNLIRDDINTAEKLAFTGTDDNAVAVGAELLKHYAKQAELATDGAVKNALYDKAAKLGNSMAHKLTEQGRAIQAASILARLTPEGMTKFAAREIQKYNEGVKLKDKIPELTPEQTKHIIEEMNGIGGMEDGLAKAKRLQDLQNYVSDLIPTSLYKKIIGVWKAGLLTGLKTTGVNVLSNASHLITEIAKDIPATMVDKIVSIFSGKRTKSFTMQGLFSGGKEGANKGIEYFKTGFDERNIGTKLDYNRLNFGKGKFARALQAYTDTVFHLLGAEDQPFYYAAKTRSLYEQAKVVAINAGLKGKEAQEVVDKLMNNPTDQMIKYATADAETAVYQNKTWLGKAAKSIQNLPGGEIVVPFGRTPSAVAMQILNYIPIGAVKTIFENIGKEKFDQKRFSEGLGRSLTGLGALGLGAYLLSKGDLTTARPVDEKEQKLWELEGKQANSIKIGGKWRQVQVLGPVGNLLLIGASFRKAYDNTGTISGASSEGLADASKAFTQQTFLTGISNFIDAISDPARYAENVAGSTLASTIPTIVSDVARATDTKERRAETIFNKFQARIPGVRETLEPQVTVLGEKRETVGNPLEVMADPTRPTTIKVTPLITELRRLWDLGYKVSPSLLGDKTGYKSLTPEQNTDLWIKTGTLIDEKVSSLITKPEYQALSDEEKSKQINKIVDIAQTKERAKKVAEIAYGLKDQDLIKKLVEAKASELMSEPVYKEYNKIKGIYKPEVKDKVTDKPLSELVPLYAKALTTDPAQALKGIFTDEKLDRVDGGLVAFQRFYGIKFTDKGGSQEYKKKAMEEIGLDWKTQQGNYKLEHIVPLTVGGDNSDSNLVPVNNADHNLYTPIDIALGSAVKKGLITRKEASQIAIDLKINKTLKPEDVYLKLQ